MLNTFDKSRSTDSDLATLPPAGWSTERGAPQRLSTERYLTPDACAALFQRIAQLTTDGDTRVSIESSWVGSTRWVRNKIKSSTDRTDQTVTITRIIRGARGAAVTNQFDDRSLKIAIQVAEQQVLRSMENLDSDYASGRRTNDTPKIFSDATYNLVAADRSGVARELVQPAIAKTMASAGYIEASVNAMGVYDTKGLAAHAVTTGSQYTVTVRSPDGSASGWAGLDHFDWKRIDTSTLSARALEKCVTSVNPVAVEPGRYTVILEPQATHAFVRVAMNDSLFVRLDNEKYDDLPYNLRRASRSGQGIAKFGMQLMDERITIDTDPMDPDAGYLPFTNDGTPYGKVTWVENGILRQLPYDFDFALEVLGSNVARPYTAAYRMSGGTATIDEMVASTRRGILVTRFLGVGMLHQRSILSSGSTADGTWLVENGKVSRPIKNFRFNASPLHSLNMVDMLGVPQRVFSPGAPAIVPAIKLQEFNFSSTSDVI